MVNILSTLALLPAAGFCYQYFATKQDEKTYPPTGDLIEVDGSKLHIQCQGQHNPGAPTIIVETGIWDCLQSWQLVQSKIATSARICTYDRAGYGWSDKGRNPRTFEQMARELKILLEKKGIQPPFIFVGHSLGGAIARYYQSQHPDEVVGMIFVDALHNEAPIFSKIFSAVSKALSYLAYFGVIRLMFKFTPPISANPLWTPTMQKTYVACNQSKTKTLQTCIDEWNGYEKSFKDLRAKARSLKDIPVTVISRDPNMPARPGMTKEASLDEFNKYKKQHLDDSPHARFVIADGSSHLVQIDRPDVVIDEIHRMIKSLEKKL